MEPVVRRFNLEVLGGGGSFPFPPKVTETGLQPLPACSGAGGLTLMASGAAVPLTKRVLPPLSLCLSLSSLSL